MSLLLRALENAAKNREAAGPAADPGRAPEPDAPAQSREPADELALEPLPQSARVEAGPRSQPHSRGSARSATADDDRSASQHQAQSVLRAGAPLRSRPGVFEWLAQRPLVAFSTAAGIFAIGYGTYLYLQLTNPGIFAPRPAPVAKPPIAQSSPPPVQSPAPPPPSIASGPVTAPPPASVLPSPAFTPGSATPAPGIAGPGTPPVPPAGSSTAPAGAIAPAAPAASAAAAPAAPAAGPGLQMQPPVSASRQPGPAAQAAVPSQKAATITPPSKPEATAAAKSETVAPRPRTARPAPARAAPPPAEGIAPNPAGQLVPVSATLSSAHQALEKGRFDEAERQYRQSLTADPRSVDAMLGLAAALVGQNRADAATQYYLRVLEQDPRNTHAQAGLLNIGGRADPVAAEARLKQLIAREPSGFLYFSLGNLYAEHGQWAPAQAAFFQAYNLAPDNPDYAFNLAVGLEHLSQPKIALNYYRRAAALAQSRGHAQFDSAALQSRIRSLETALAETP